MASERYKNAIMGKRQTTPPIWMMRQAGRYQSSYRRLREKYTFGELCQTPELAAQVAMLPIQEFDFDLAILFSDILFPLEALGIPLEYSPAPKLGFGLTPANISQLKPWQEAAQSLQFQAEAIRLTREALPQEKSLIGFIGGPVTLFSYAVENEHKGNLTKTKTNYTLFQKFCEKIEPLLVENIQSQLDAGAELVMIFDTAAGELSYSDFLRFVVPGLKTISERHPQKTGYFAKAVHLDHVLAIQSACPKLAGFGFDYRFDLSKVFGQTQGFVQGNFDPNLLFLPKADLSVKLDEYIESIKAVRPEKRAAWVCGLGHGVLPKTPEANVRFFIEKIRKAFS